MKIGIMSMQRIVNNGSFLQSYSLMKNIERMGHEVVFVDYEPGSVLVEKEFENNSIFDSVNSVIKKVKKRLIFKRGDMDPDWEIYTDWSKDYRQNMMPLLGLSEDKQYKVPVDMLVIGSDEVFNCLQPNPEVGFSEQLFGGDNNAKRVISYAASFGNTSINGLKKYGIENRVSQLLDKMDDISVRDKNSVSIVQNLTQKTPQYHVDPVFLYDYEKEMTTKVADQGYIVVYAYSLRIQEKEAKAILKFAKKHNKKIICLAGVQEYFGGFINTNPFESLAYVKNADYVITDTFHGTVFSIKYNKQFAAIARDGEGTKYGNSNKMIDLLSRFSLENRIVNDINKLESILLEEQDFTNVNNIISKERAISLEYLERNIAQIHN